MTLSIMALSIMTLSIITLSIMRWTEKRPRVTSLPYVSAALVYVCY
jgi:hypothetical protein